MPRVFSSKNLVSLANRVRTSEAAVSFLQQNGILHSKTRCSKCFNELTDMRRRPGTSYWYFHCQPCQTSVSIRNKTILSHSKIGLRTFVMLAYTFIMCQGLTIAQKIHEVFFLELVLKILCAYSRLTLTMATTTTLRYQPVGTLTFPPPRVSNTRRSSETLYPRL